MTQLTKRYITFLLLLFCSPLLVAQGLGGLTTSPYGGVYSIGLQPASLARMPYKLDVNAIGASANLLIKDLVPQSEVGNVLYEGDQFTFATLLETQQQNFFLSGSILMPSVAYSLNEKSGVAFNWRIRAVGFGTVTNGNVGLLAANDFDVAVLGSLPTIQSGVGVLCSWQELGLSYAYNVLDKGKHKLDLGATANYLIGGGSGFIELQFLDVQYDHENNEITDVSGQLSLTYNNELDEISKGESKRLFNSSGYSFNFGAIYEFADDRHLETDVDRLHQPNYLFRVATSMRDVGRIGFDASPNSAVYNLDLTEPIDGEYFSDMQNFSDFTSRMGT
ncbi:MAG: DUF5723 family protein, partial [Schleiferiaceae bacterium]|nr:DUF5723 family protein [Schleiferiaceae bacterium]